MKKNLIKNIIFIIPIIIFYSCSISFPPEKDYQYEIDDSKQYNNPFINSTETSKLDFGLSKEEVLNILGEPLFVAHGTDSTKTITWIYEVRTILVQGDIIQKESNISFIDDAVQFSKSNSTDLIIVDTTGKLHIDTKEIITTTSSLEEITDTKSVKKIIDEEYIPFKSNDQFKHDTPIHKLGLEFIDNKLANWKPYCDSSNDCSDNKICFDNECIISDEDDEINDRLIEKLNLMNLIRKRIQN